MNEERTKEPRGSQLAAARTDRGREERERKDEGKQGAGHERSGVSDARKRAAAICERRRERREQRNDEGRTRRVE